MGGPIGPPHTSATRITSTIVPSTRPQSAGTTTSVSASATLVTTPDAWFGSGGRLRRRLRGVPIRTETLLERMSASTIVEDDAGSTPG